MRTAFARAAAHGGPFHDSPDGAPGRRNRRAIGSRRVLAARFSGRRHRDDPYGRVVRIGARRPDRAARLEVAPSERPADTVEDQAHAALRALHADLDEAL